MLNRSVAARGNWEMKNQKVTMTIAKLISVSVVLVPFLLLSGCSGGNNTPAVQISNTSGTDARIYGGSKCVCSVPSGGETTIRLEHGSEWNVMVGAFQGKFRLYPRWNLPLVRSIDYVVTIGGKPFAVDGKETPCIEIDPKVTIVNRGDAKANFGTNECNIIAVNGEKLGVGGNAFMIGDTVVFQKGGDSQTLFVHNLMMGGKDSVELGQEKSIRLGRRIVAMETR